MPKDTSLSKAPGKGRGTSQGEKPKLTDLRAIRSRDAFRAAMLTLLDQKPLESILIRDITSVARTGYATFYRHYPTKEALLDDVARHQVRQLVEISRPVMDSADVLSAYKTLFTHVELHRAVWRTLLAGGAADAIKQELLRVSLEVTSARGDVDMSPSVEVRVILVVTCTVELLAWWLSHPNQMTVAEVAQFLESLVTTPLVAPNQTIASPSLSDE